MYIDCIGQLLRVDEREGEAGAALSSGAPASVDEQLGRGW